MSLLLALLLAGVAPAGLKGVVNADKAKKLPAAARAALVNDGFTVVEGRERDFFSVYDQNAYEKVPSFISTDVVLHVFHVRFDEEVASLERKLAQPALTAFAVKQLARALAAWPATGAPSPALRSLTQYHAIALLLLDPGAKLDPRLTGVNEDVEKLVAARGRGTVSACPAALEFSLFSPRGHYERSPLEGYFRAVTFYSQCGFALTGDGLSRALDVARLVDADAGKSLVQVRSLQDFVSGPADDVGLEALAPHLASLPAWPAPLPPAALEAVRAKLTKGPTVPTLDGAGPTFRLLGGSLTPDTALLGKTAGTPERPLPSVLDVLSALGSPEAKRLLAPSPALSQRLEQPLPAGGGLAARWLEVLRVLLTKPAAQPAFAATDAWARRTVVAAAGSYAELRHDTLLYVKQPMVMAEGGDARELPASKVGGYVEPRPEVYRALLELTSELAKRGGDGAALEEFLRFLVEVSELELSNKPFPKAMDERLRTVGGELEHLSRLHGDDSPPQALVADVFTAVLPDGSTRVLHLAVGDVDELWVVAPRAGQLVLMRGGAFSFYEFAEGQRLSDGQWNVRLFEGPPQRPAWARPVEVKSKAGVAPK